MTSRIARAGSEFLANKAKDAGNEYATRKVQNMKPEDPLYETYVDKNGKKKKRKRELPPGISEREAKILKSVRRRAHCLDNSIKVMGFNFGWAAIFGLVPGIGDFADVILSVILVLRKAQQANPPPAVLARMVSNCVIAGMVGIVPIFGDIAIGVYKPNTRNALLLEQWLREKGEKARLERENALQERSLQPSVPEASGTHITMVRKKA